MPADNADQLLATRIRRGDRDAWAECIDQFEGRLLAFVASRLNDRATSEDVVQETFLGFLIALPNYDPQTPLENFLFAIAAHKLTDVLRRRGSRPQLRSLNRGDRAASADEDTDATEPASHARGASSLVRSHERKTLEERVLRDVLGKLIRQWTAGGDFERLKCAELLFVLGWANKAVAQRLAISEQAVAHHKFFVLSKIRDAVQNSPWTSDIDVDSLVAGSE